jgi:hypothetical protein
MFQYYNIKSVAEKPTTLQMVASLTSEQRAAILNGFAKDVKFKKLATEQHINRYVVAHLYKKIYEIEKMACSLMRGEVLITPAVYEEGELITPAEYNKIPGTVTALKSKIAELFKDDFTIAQSNAIVSKMILYSKFAGNGIWSFYSTEIKK